VLAHDGAWNGQQIIPRQWLLDATTITPGEGFRRPGIATAYYGYGYQVWIFPGQRRQFALLGIHGQKIFVDPAAQLVLVHTSAQINPTAPGPVELIALWNALVKKLAP
jgi:CubicO group peptidase (beta-lactamase class C family)